MTTVAVRPPSGPSQLIAAEIRAELGRRQLSNRQLALMIDGVSYAWVNRRISACDVEMTFEDVQRIADTLGIPVTRFLAPWIGNAPSPTGQDTGAYQPEISTAREHNVIDLRVRSQRLGDSPGGMRTTRTAAA